MSHIPLESREFTDFESASNFFVAVAYNALQRRKQGVNELSALFYSATIQMLLFTS